MKTQRIYKNRGFQDDFCPHRMCVCGGGGDSNKSHKSRHIYLHITNSEQRKLGSDCPSAGKLWCVQRPRRKHINAAFAPEERGDYSKFLPQEQE